MLISGSTGNSKAVCLTYEQILAVVEGKSAVVELPSDRSFFNWIALDYIADMVKIHIQAFFLGADQTYIHNADIITNPFEFIHLIDYHRVFRTFAPNFFFARLRDRRS
jgi:acyl-CoA synthetase (AMP-forming)/AMP-acid ligase II